MAFAILACLAVASSAQPAIACSVCYGDPNSALAKGVNAGVLVLGGVVSVMLLMIASVFVSWMRRAAALEGADARGATGG